MTNHKRNMNESSSNESNEENLREAIQRPAENRLSQRREENDRGQVEFPQSHHQTGYNRNTFRHRIPTNQIAPLSDRAESDDHQGQGSSGQISVSAREARPTTTAAVVRPHPTAIQQYPVQHLNMNTYVGPEALNSILRQQHERHMETIARIAEISNSHLSMILNHFGNNHGSQRGQRAHYPEQLDFNQRDSNDADFLTGLRREHAPNPQEIHRPRNDASGEETEKIDIPEQTSPSPADQNLTTRQVQQQEAGNLDLPPATRQVEQEEAENAELPLANPTDLVENGRAKRTARGRPRRPPVPDPVLRTARNEIIGYGSKFNPEFFQYSVYTCSKCQLVFNQISVVRRHYLKEHRE